MFIDRCLFTFSCVCHDSARHCSGYLPYGYSFAAIRLYPYSAPLVVGACLRKVCREKPAVMMLHIFDRSVYRKPVGMHVQGRHEHREHHGFLLEILPFEGALHSHYATVDRAYHHPHALAAVMTLRATEKIEDEAIDYRGKDTEACRNQNRRHKEPYRHIKHCQYYKQ